MIANNNQSSCLKEIYNNYFTIRTAVNGKGGFNVSVFTFEKEVKQGLITFKVFDKDNFHFDVFKDIDPYIQEQLIATLCHLDTLMFENGAKTGDIKGLMMQMDPDEWESRHGTAPILVLHQDNKLNIDLLNVLLREDYKFFPMYRDSDPNDCYTPNDYEKYGLSVVYTE